MGWIPSTVRLGKKGDKKKKKKGRKQKLWILLHDFFLC
jgi:hypothetical protein